MANILTTAYTSIVINRNISLAYITKIEKEKNKVKSIRRSRTPGSVNG